MQFRALGKDQREAILKALNDDAEKLIAEFGTEASRDPEISRLREQMRECNRHFNQLASQCVDDGQCFRKVAFVAFKVFYRRARLVSLRPLPVHQIVVSFLCSQQCIF